MRPNKEIERFHDSTQHESALAPPIEPPPGLQTTTLTQA
jgi:hypothetical protein